MPTLHRTNIYLNADDVRYLQEIFGYGWTSQVRDMVSKKVKDIKETRKAAKLTVEDWIGESDE